MEQYRNDIASIEDTKHKVVSRLQELSAEPVILDEDKGDLASNLLASSAISKRFMVSGANPII